MSVIVIVLFSLIELCTAQAERNANTTGALYYYLHQNEPITLNCFSGCTRTLGSNAACSIYQNDQPTGQESLRITGGTDCGYYHARCSNGLVADWWRIVASSSELPCNRLFTLRFYQNETHFGIKPNILFPTKHFPILYFEYRIGKRNKIEFDDSVVYFRKEDSDATTEYQVVLNVGEPTYLYSKKYTRTEILELAQYTMPSDTDSTTPTPVSDPTSGNQGTNDSVLNKPKNGAVMVAVIAGTLIGLLVVSVGISITVCLLFKKYYKRSKANHCSPLQYVQVHGGTGTNETQRAMQHENASPVGVVPDVQEPEQGAESHHANHSGATNCTGERSPAQCGNHTAYAPPVGVVPDVQELEQGAKSHCVNDSATNCTGGQSPAQCGNRTALSSHPDLCDLVEWMQIPVSSKWYELGLRLDVKGLNNIKADNSTIKDRYNEMMSEWKNQCPNGTWQDVVDGLRCDSVRLNSVAEDVIKKLTK